MQSFPAVICGLMAEALFCQVGPTIRPEANGQLQEVEALHKARGTEEKSSAMPVTVGASLPWRSLASEAGDDSTVPVSNIAEHEPSAAARKVVERAERLSKKGRHEQAIAVYRRAVALDPGYYDAANALALELEAAGQNSEAQTVLRHLTQTAPQHVLAFVNLAALLRQEHRYPEMEAVARQAIKAHAYSLAANYLLGTALVVQGKWTNEAKIELQYAEVRYAEAGALLKKWPQKPTAN
jgi:tetratricopeptide (TPR) repeat protein